MNVDADVPNSPIVLDGTVVCVVVVQVVTAGALSRHDVRGALDSYSNSPP